VLTKARRGMAWSPVLSWRKQRGPDFRVVYQYTCAQSHRSTRAYNLGGRGGSLVAAEAGEEGGEERHFLDGV